MCLIGNIAYPVVAVLVCALFVLKLAQLACGPRDAPRWFLTAMLLFCAAAFGSDWPGMWRRLNGLDRYGDLATLISQCCVVCMTASASALLTTWGYPTERLRSRLVPRLAASASVLITMIVLFVHSEPGHAHDARAFVRWYAGSGTYDGYVLLYVLAFTVTIAEIIVLSSRYARAARDRWLRAGLRTTGIGGGIAQVYAATRIADIVASQFGTDLQAMDGVAAAAAGLGGLLVTTGLSLPSFAPCARRLGHWSCCYYAYLRLDRLWRSLTAVAPEFVLDSAVSSRWWPTDIDFRLQRRVVEIHDAMHELPALAVATLGTVMPDQQLVRVERGLRVAVTAASTEEASIPAPRSGDRPLDRDIAWLVRVARAYRVATSDPAVTPAPSTTGPA